MKRSLALGLIFALFCLVPADAARKKKASPKKRASARKEAAPRKRR